MAVENAVWVEALKRLAGEVRPVVKGRQCVVYTAVAGGYDRVASPDSQGSEAAFVCFTTGFPLPSDPWHAVMVDFQYRSDRRLAKIFKLFPHLLFPDVQYSLWIDGNVKCKISPVDLVDEYLRNTGMGLACLRHNKRGCLYDEAEECIRAGKDDESVILRQIRAYEKEGYPHGRGLIQGRVLLRDHYDPLVSRTMDVWWDEVDRGSERDQISFNYAAWKSGLEYETMPFDIDEGDDFEVLPHSFERGFVGMIRVWFGRVRRVLRSLRRSGEIDRGSS